MAGRSKQSDCIVNAAMLTACRLCGSHFGLRTRHHFTVGADLRAGGLAADGAWVERRPILVLHGAGPGSFLCVLFEKAAIESLFGAGRFGFETIEHFFVEEHFRALGHRAFFHNVIDSIQYRVGGDLSFAEPIQGFHFFCKPFDRGRQTGALLLQVLGLPMQHVAQKARRFVVEIVASRHHVIILFDRRAIELIAFDGPTRGTGGAMDEHGQLANAGACLFLNRMHDQLRLVRLRKLGGESLDFLVRCVGIAGYAEIDIQRVRAIAEREEDVPQRQTILAARDGDENPIVRPEHPFGFNRPSDLFVHELSHAQFTKSRIVAGKADHRFGFTLRAIHIKAVENALQRRSQSPVSLRRTPLRVRLSRRVPCGLAEGRFEQPDSLLECTTRLLSNCGMSNANC